MSTSSGQKERSNPTSWLAWASSAALVGALARAASLSLGAAPDTLLSAVATASAGLALGAQAQPGLARGRAPWLVAGLAAPLAIILGLDMILGVLAPLGLDAPRWILAALVLLAFIPAGRVLASARFGALAAAPGLLLGALGGAPAALVAALGLVLSARDTVRAADRPSPGPTLGALAAAAAGGVGLLALRGGLDPSPTGLLAFGVAGLVGATAAARVRRLRPGDAALLGGLVLALMWLGLGAGGFLLSDVAARAGTLGRSGETAAALLILDAPLALVGLLAGALAGLCARGASLGLGAALGLGLAVPLMSQGVWGPLIASGALGASAVLWGQRRSQLLGVGLAGASAALALLTSPPNAASLVRGRFAVLRDAGAANHDQKVRDAMASGWDGWSDGVAGAVRAPPATWRKANARADGTSRPGGQTWPVEPVQVETDGLVAEARSRAGDAEELSARLAGLLAEKKDHALVLGDETGRALRALVDQGFGSVDVSTPLPPIVRATARLDPGAERAWLSAVVRLLPVHPEYLLRLDGKQDAIVEINRAPWADGARGALSPQHLAAASNQLAPGGVYILCAHLGWWPDGAPAAMLSALRASFGHVQLWMPPAGADSAILVASQVAPPLSRLIERLGGDPAAPAPEPLRALGLDSAVDLASLAISTGEQLGDGAAAPALALNAALFSKPVLHLSGFASKTSAPEQIWDLSGTTPETSRGLTERLAARARFLDVLGSAARGDMEEVFTAARSLLRMEGEAGRAALDPLLEPHLARGRAALDQASREGLASPRYDEARSAAVTAQMLNPDSPLPLVMLGDIALAQGNTRQAEEQYKAALARDEAQLPALFGLARVYRLMRDRTSAEQSLREATRVAPRAWSAWQNLGVYLLETDQNAEAEDCLRRAASLASAEPTDADPDNKDPARYAPHLALAELFLKTDAPVRALAEAERARQEGGGAYAWYLVGRSHFDLAQYIEAESDFRAAVLADPSMIEARGAIGHLRALQRDWRSAAESFRAVLAVDPNNQPARENLASVLAEQAREAAREGTTGNVGPTPASADPNAPAPPTTP